MKCFHIMVDHIHQKRIYINWINANLFVYSSNYSHLKFVHKRCALSLEHEGTSVLTKAEPFIKQAILLKKKIPTCWSMAIS